MRRTFVELGLTALIVVGAVGLTPAAAFAGKGGSAVKGSGGASSVSVVMVNDVNRDGSANYGDTITFSVSSSATTQPYVELTCAQNGTVVYQHTAGIYPGYPWSQNYVLSSNYWTSGGASCSAILEYNTRRGTSTLATLDFAVNA
jgi:hypothetical protein